MKINKNQRNWIIIGLCLIVLFMSIGYASFSSKLTITGTSIVTSTFNIQITDIQEKEIVGSAKAEESSITSTTATFNTNLSVPGDSITYEVKIENKGDIDANLDQMTIEDENNPAILYQIIGISENDIVGGHSNKTFDVKVTYNQEVTTQPENLNSKLTVKLHFNQNK